MPSPIDINRDFPTFLSNEEEEKEVVTSVLRFDKHDITTKYGYIAARNSTITKYNICHIDPYMNIECPEEWKSVAWYKPSIHPAQTCDNKDEPIPTNDLNLLHHADVVLFNNSEIDVKYQLMATSNSGEHNVFIKKVIKSPNGKDFTMKEFIKEVFDNIQKDYKFHLPKSAELDGNDYPNELNYITVNFYKNVVNIEMVY